jgi:hypothetical protein
MKNEVKNKPQSSEIKNDKKNKQEAAAYPAQPPHVPQHAGFYPQGNRYIRSWVEGTPEQEK